MNVNLLVKNITMVLFSVCMIVAVPALSAAEQKNKKQHGKNHHRHAPVRISASPIVAEVDVELSQARRISFDKQGDLWMAHWGAGTLLKIDKSDHVTVVARDLNEPSGVAFDSFGNTYITLHAGGLAKMGSVIRIDAEGIETIFAEGLTGPTDLAFNNEGELFVACFHDDSIMKVGSMGEVTTFAVQIPAPASIAFDKKNNLYTVSSTKGTAYKISTEGNAKVIARGLNVPSDITFDHRGRLVITNYDGTELSYIDKNGISRTYAFVPEGTISVEFDQQGNAILLNWDENTLVKVLSTLSIPCPHCKKPIPLKFRPRKIEKSTPENMEKVDVI